MLFSRRTILASIPPTIIASRSISFAQSVSADGGASVNTAVAPTTTTTPATTPATTTAPTPTAAPRPSPVVTGPVVDFSLPTTAGRERNVSAYRGRVVVLFYETRGAITQNQHVKDAMGRRFDADRSLVNRFSLIAACNVAEYNSWPSQYFAREAISAVARAQRIELWLDWQRTLIQRLSLRDATSNIVLIDKQGHVRSRRFGRVADDQVQPLITEMMTLAAE